MKVTYLPTWKKGATAEERLLELAQIAAAHPERFGKFILLYEETMPNGNTILRRWVECDTNAALGLMAIASHELIQDSHKT